MVVRLIYYLLCLCVVFSQHSTLTRVYICVFCDSRWGLSAKLPCPALLSYIFAPTAGCHWCDFCLPCVSVHIYPRPFVTRLASLARSRRTNTLTWAHPAMTIIILTSSVIHHTCTLWKFSWPYVTILASARTSVSPLVSFCVSSHMYPIRLIRPHRCPLERFLELLHALADTMNLVLCFCLLWHRSQYG